MSCFLYITENEQSGRVKIKLNTNKYLRISNIFRIFVNIQIEEIEKHY